MSAHEGFQIAKGRSSTTPACAFAGEQVIMDFMVGLPKTTTGHDCILVFTDKLTRMIHLAATVTTCTAEQAADLFLTHVYRLHGLPRSIVSDRDNCFVSHFWKALHQMLGTKLKLSTAYHPETDGATERSNQTVETMLWAYVSNQPEQWGRFLHLVEFAFNNSTNAATKVSPFFMNAGMHPRFMLKAIILVHAQVPTAAEFVKKRYDIQQQARQNALLAQNQQAQTASQRRRDVIFQVGDYVVLSIRNLTPLGISLHQHKQANWGTSM